MLLERSRREPRGISARDMDPLDIALLAKFDPSGRHGLDASLTLIKHLALVIDI